MLLETAFICLALNTYSRAKNQSLVGQVATAQVVMNRVADDRYPNTVCEVVKQGPTRPSWVKIQLRNIQLDTDANSVGYCDGKPRCS